MCEFFFAKQYRRGFLQQHCKYNPTADLIATRLRKSFSTREIPECRGLAPRKGIKISAIKKKS